MAQQKEKMNKIKQHLHTSPPRSEWISLLIFASQCSHHKEHTLRRLKHLSSCKHNSLFNYTDNEMQRGASVDSPNFFKTSYFPIGGRDLQDSRGRSQENKDKA